MLLDGQLLDALPDVAAAPPQRPAEERLIAGPRARPATAIDASRHSQTTRIAPTTTTWTAAFTAEREAVGHERRRGSRRRREDAT